MVDKFLSKKVKFTKTVANISQNTMGAEVQTFRRRPCARRGPAASIQEKKLSSFVVSNLTKSETINNLN